MADQQPGLERRATVTRLYVYTEILGSGDCYVYIRQMLDFFRRIKRRYGRHLEIAGFGFVQTCWIPLVRVIDLRTWLSDGSHIQVLDKCMQRRTTHACISTSC
jgi:hypothetical protein